MQSVERIFWFVIELEDKWLLLQMPSLLTSAAGGASGGQQGVAEKIADSSPLFSSRDACIIHKVSDSTDFA